MFKILKQLALFACFIIAAAGYSQDRTIDSLKLLVQNPKVHDTVKLYSLLIAKSQNYNETDKEYHILNRMQGDYAMKCLKKKVSPKVHKAYVQCLADYYQGLMTEYKEKGDTPRALAAIDKSIALFKSEKLYNDMYFAVMTKGRFYAKIKEYQKATDCLFAALRYFEKHPGDNPVVEIGSVCSLLADLYVNQKNYEKAIEYSKRVIVCCDANKSLEYEDGTDHTRFVSYSVIGVSYRNLKKYDEAVYYLNKALELAKKSNSSFKISYVLTRIGSVKVAQQKYDEAEAILNEALKGEPDPKSLANGYTSMAQLYFAKKDYDKAYSFITKGLDLSTETGNLDLQEVGSELLFKLSTIRKDYRKALEMYKLHDSIVDYKKGETSKNVLEKQQLKYDFEKKELKLKLDAEKKNAVKNNWLIGLSGLLLLILAGGYFYYRNNKQKQAITVLEKEQIKQKLLVTQMNPHFIFNSIDNIQGLIYDKKDTEAVNYLTKFSKLTRQILENSNENYISLAEEIEMTQNYLAIQQLLYDNKFSFSIEVEDNIDQEAILLPPMLTQPFIENAIKHGLSNTTAQGKIDIHFYLKESKLYFEVTDNGKGFDTAPKINGHKSLAMTITKERLVSYTKNQDFVVLTDNIKDNDENVVGAKVSFEIPYIYEN
ncbi:tetratricopeptide repeat-containing sensor histidine kinase [Flavobacterium suncheonense]|uniref:tetratricopeptide repeat-containing sensor histidine kinase n=1 Tax=Flavobacterium suncheonense TaxID=350894 RepID=UPI0004156E67|nr:histidine kinase [Flavobacterium suncheonense]